MFGTGSTLMMNSAFGAGSGGGLALQGLPAMSGAGEAGAGGLGALMGPLALGMMGFGAAFNAINVMKQAKQQKRDMQDQAREIRRQADVEGQTNLDMQLIERDAADKVGEHIISQGTKSGVSVAGSLSLTNYRKAKIQEIEDMINFRSRRSVEKQTSMNLQANRLDRAARRVVKDAKWKQFSDILGGAANIGMAGYQMGMWGGKQDV